MKALAILLAVVFFALAIFAFTGMVNGGAHGVAHAAGLDGTTHTKHGVLYVILALLSLVWLRFQSAQRVSGVR